MKAFDYILAWLLGTIIAAAIIYLMIAFLSWDLVLSSGQWTALRFLTALAAFALVVALTKAKK